MPTASTTETMTWFRVRFRLVEESIRILIPTQAIMPNRRSIRPPRTAGGMVFSAPAIFPTKENTMAVIAEMRSTLGSVILVRDTAPVTSE